MADLLLAPETHPLAGATELLRLWDAADSALDRERLLAYARVVVARRPGPARPDRD